MNINKYFSDNGDKYNWNIFVFESGEYTAKNCIDLSNGEKVIDMKSSSGVLLSKITRDKDNDKIIQILIHNNSNLHPFL